MKTKREKPGRKPIKDKVEGITIYVKQSVIKRMGGKSNCRGILLVEVEKW